MNIQTRLREDLWEAVRSSYTKGNYSGAITDAMLHLSNMVRERSGVDGDGTALVGAVFGGADPKLKVNSLRTETERNIQKGVEQLLRGLYQAVRNPRSHAKVEDSEEDADAIILFVNFLLGIISRAKAPFSQSAFMDRILDPHFVPSEEYAQILVGEIPERFRLDLMLEVWERRNETNENHRQFISLLMAELSEADRQTCYDTISELLKYRADDTIRAVLAVLPEGAWKNIERSAALRTEHRIARNITEGQYSSKNPRALRGGLATWARRHFPHFHDRASIYKALVRKLGSGNQEEEDYVLEFFFNSLDDLADEPGFALQATLRRKLKAGNGRFKQALDKAWLWRDAKWSETTAKEINNYRESDYDAFEPPTLDEDDLPF